MVGADMKLILCLDINIILNYNDYKYEKNTNK